MTRAKHIFSILTVYPLLLSAALLTGCASVKLASTADDAKAKSFATNPNQANLYIYRNEFIGAAIQMPVVVDGKEIGKTGAKTYFALSVPPGNHSIISKAENDASLNVMTEAGKNYFVWQEVKMGLLMARTKLQLVDAATGQAGVNESKLLDTGDGSANASVQKTNAAEMKTATPSTPANNASAERSVAATSKIAPTGSYTLPSPPNQLAANNNDSAPLKIEKVPFVIGVSSVTVERLAKQQSCNSTQGAGLVVAQGTIEYYRIGCEDGRVLKARCEIRQCSFIENK